MYLLILCGCAKITINTMPIIINISLNSHPKLCPAKSIHCKKTRFIPIKFNIKDKKPNIKNKKPKVSKGVFKFDFTLQN